MALESQAYHNFDTDEDNSVLRGIADGYKNDGDEELRKNEFQRAIDCYTKGITVECKDDRLNALLYTNRAHVYILIGSYDDALKDAKSARACQPTFLSAIEKGACAFFELSMYREAFTWCDDGLVINQEDRTLQEMKERFLHKLCESGTDVEQDKAVALQSQENVSFMDRTMQVVLGMQTICRKGYSQIVSGEEYETIYSKVDGLIYSVKGWKEVAFAFKSYFNLFTKGEDIEEYQMSGFSVPLNVDDVKKGTENFERDLNVAKNCGSKEEESRACENLGKCHHFLGNFKEAIGYHKEHLNISLVTMDRAGEGRAYGNLGAAYFSLDDFEQAVPLFKLNHSIAKEVGPRASEGQASYNLGNIYLTRGNYEEAKKYFEQHLEIAREVGDRAGEGRACGNLGLVCRCQKEFKQALEYDEQFLSIARQIGNQAWEGDAYRNLGEAYFELLDLEQAINYYKLHLTIVKELGCREEEGKVCCNLGNVCFGLCDFKQAFEYHKLSLNIAKELEDRPSQAHAYGKLSDDCYNLGDYKQAVEYGNLNLAISKEMGLTTEEAAAYQRLGRAFHVLGEFEEAFLSYKLFLAASEKRGNLMAQGRAYGNLGNVFHSIGQYKEAIEHHDRHRTIAESLNELFEQGCAYRNIGVSHQSLREPEKAIEYFKKCLSITKKVGDRKFEGIVYGNLGDAYLDINDFQRAIRYQELHLNISKEVGNTIEQGYANYSLGCVYEKKENLSKAFHCFQTSIERFKSLDVLLQNKDNWRISFQDNCQMAHVALCRILIKQKKWEDALLVAEEGRAQVLMNLMKSHYGVHENETIELVERKQNVFDVQSNTLFLALDGNKMNRWLILENGDVFLSSEEVGTDSQTSAKEFFESLNNSIYLETEIEENVSCEDRSLNVLRQETVVHRKAGEHHPQPAHLKHSTLRRLYGAIILPLVNLIDGDEVVIVPDGPLFLTPFCALAESSSCYLCDRFRVRLAPSLSSLRVILNSREEYHNTQGELLVGDPFVDEVVFPNGRKLEPLPHARTEVEKIGEILMTDVLIGRRATKDEVLRRMKDVALIHIAAHGSMETGEIVLCPNPNRACRIPEYEDFLLTMSDVSNVKLRARLVVLSCCHSARGRVKAEGVVGIARAFLAAGARSVLVSLWAINDEATLKFMMNFYNHLLAGRSASSSLTQAMKCLRESREFKDEKFWAPFELIGDDVTLDFWHG